MIANEKQAVNLQELSFGPFSLCNNHLLFVLVCCWNVTTYMNQLQVDIQHT